MGEDIYIWDREKNLSNQKKHGLSFETASLVFDDELSMIFEDTEHSIGELRYIIIGKVEDIICVVFTERGEKIRIISARKATGKERSVYYGNDLY